MLRRQQGLLHSLFSGGGGGSRSGNQPRVFPNHRPKETSAERFKYQVVNPHNHKMKQAAEKYSREDGRVWNKEMRQRSGALLFRSSIAREARQLKQQLRSERVALTYQQQNFPSTHSAIQNLKRLR